MYRRDGARHGGFDLVCECTDLLLFVVDPDKWQRQKPPLVDEPGASTRGAVNDGRCARSVDSTSMPSLAGRGYHWRRQKARHATASAEPTGGTADV